MSHIKSPLHRIDFIVYCSKQAIFKTHIRLTPLLYQLKQHVIRYSFIGMASLICITILKQYTAAQSIFTLQTLMQCVAIASTIIIIILICYIVGIIIYIIDAPYQSYLEVQMEASKILNDYKDAISIIEKDKMPRYDGISINQVAKQLLAEIERNRTLKGINIGCPEHKYLDAMIDMMEKNEEHNELMDILYKLRQKTIAQEQYKNISTARVNQYEFSYLPILTKAEDEIRKYIASYKNA